MSETLDMSERDARPSLDKENAAALLNLDKNLLNVLSAPLGKVASG